jgi:hypothetical protein
MDDVSRPQTLTISIPRSWLYFFGALAINLSLWFALFYLGQIHPDYSSTPAMPVRTVTPQEWEAIHRRDYVKGERKIVQSDEADPTEQAVADPFPAEYVGEKTRRVKKEILSQGQDPEGTLDDVGPPPEASADRALHKLFASGEKIPFQPGPGRFPVAAKDEPPAPPKVSAHGRRLSMDDLGKSVEMGAKTLLNTDEYRFYGFVSRLKEAVYPLWRKNLNFYTSQTHMTRGEFVIRGTLVMKDDGSFEAIEDWVPCGVNSLDRSVSEAFQDLPRIPNPPTEMIEEDGKLRLKFSFRVEHDASNVVVDYRRSEDDLPRGAR